MGQGRATWWLRLGVWGGLLVVLPAVVLIHQTQRHPEMLMLPGAGDWMLWRPGDWRSGYADDYWAALAQRPAEVHFQRDFFQPSTGTPPGKLSLRALGRAEVELNGHVLAPVRTGADWKQTSIYDLTPALRVGTNRLIVRVRGEERMAALQVTGPAELATPQGWRAWGDGEDATTARRVVTLTELASSRPAAWMNGGAAPWLRVGIMIWVAWWVGVIGWIGWRWIRAGHTASALPPKPSPHRQGLVLGALVLVVSGLHGWNAWRVEPWRGPDTEGHMDHVRLVARTGRPVVATDCWECYQPPGYYYVAAGVYRLSGGDGHAVGSPLKTAPDLGAFKAVQGSGVLWGVGLMLATWALLRLVEPGLSLGGKVAAVGLAGLAPIAVTSAPLVNVSLFAALVSTLALLGVVRTFQRYGTEPIPWWTAGGLGLLLGAAMLVKFSAVLPAAAVGLVLLGRAGTQPGRGRGLVAAGLFGLGVLGVCGWYYGRNVMLFGQPFYGNWEADAHVQTPTFRWLGYYLRFGDFLGAHPESARWTGWWDGLYVSFWTGDAARYFLADWMRGAMLALSLLPVLALPVTLALMLGLGRTLRSAWRRTWDAQAQIDCLLFTLIWLHGGALLWFSLRIPADGAVTARYALELLPVLAVLLARGRAMLDQGLPWSRRLLDISLIGGAAAVLYALRLG